MKFIIFIILISLIVSLKKKNNELEAKLNSKINEFENKNYNGKTDTRTFEEKLEGKRKSAKIYYEKKEKFWDSESEQIIFEKVNRRLPYDFVILPHVSLREIFKHKFDNKEGFKNLSYYHVDMLICSKEYMTPLMGIEFDGEGHEKDEQKLRDEFKNSLFGMASIPLIRVDDKEIDEKVLYDLIKEEFKRAKLCKKCGSPMEKIKGVNGEFYGCSNFKTGKCRNSENIDTIWF